MNEGVADQDRGAVAVAAPEARQLGAGREDRVRSGAIAAAELIIVDHHGAWEQRRRAALDNARAAVAVPSDASADRQPRIVLRGFPANDLVHEPPADDAAGNIAGAASRCGGLVVAFGGRFDATATDRLRGRAAELRRRCGGELLLEFSGLSAGCHTVLARTLARLRMQALVEGLRVELHHAPADLLGALGLHERRSPIVTSFGIRDGAVP